MIQININLVFTIINLIVLYILMKKFLFGPIINVIDKRKEMIDRQFEDAKKQEDEANGLKEQYENALKSAKEESLKIVEQAKQEAADRTDRSAKEAQAQADAILAKAKEDIAAERENAMRQVQGEVASLAMDAASKIIGKGQSAEENSALYDEFLRKAGDPDDSSN